MRAALATLILVFVGALSACGDDPPPKKQIAASDFSDPANGVAFRAPAGAVIGEGRKTQVVVLRRGDSTLVVSRFERDGERLPESRGDYERAASALETQYVSQARRQPGTVKTKAASSGGNRSVVVATARDGSKGHHVHFYEYGSEYVVDCVSPEADFAQSERLLCGPVLESLEISQPTS